MPYSGQIESYSRSSLPPAELRRNLQVLDPIALRSRRPGAPIHSPAPKPMSPEGFITRDPALLRMLQQLSQRIAPSPCAVLVLGETGTGKELIARAIHRSSERRNGPLVAINCAAINPSLLESELFGHVKGAFTGAMREKKGRFAEAHRGTLFLDELGDMPLAMQAALLRVLETGVVEPVGSEREAHCQVDVRVVAATSLDLEQRVREGRFRADLYYRLAELVVRLPPLRARCGDIEALAQHLLETFSVGRELRLEANALAALATHDWPGNVRELRNVMRRLVVLAEGEVITRDQVEEQLLPLRGVTASGYANAKEADPPEGDLSPSEGPRQERPHADRAGDSFCSPHQPPVAAEVARVAPAVPSPRDERILPEACRGNPSPRSGLEPIEPLERGELSPFERREQLQLEHLRRHRFSPAACGADPGYPGNRTTADRHLRILMCRALLLSIWSVPRAVLLLTGGRDAGMERQLTRRLQQFLGSLQVRLERTSDAELRCQLQREYRSAYAPLASVVDALKANRVGAMGGGPT